MKLELLKLRAPDKGLVTAPQPPSPVIDVDQFHLADTVRLFDEVGLDDEFVAVPFFRDAEG
jgi:hypothetical protein